MKLIFIYSGAAAGKLTVARELAALTGLKLFHNHLIVDAVAAVFPFASEAFICLREQFWMATFRAAAAVGQALIFTFAPEGSVAADFPERSRALVESCGGEVVFVRLVVPPGEQERRIDNASRGEFGKLRSLELLCLLRAEFDRCEAAMPPAAVTIDTALVKPADAARTIARELGL